MKRALLSAVMLLSSSSFATPPANCRVDPQWGSQLYWEVILEPAMIRHCLTTIAEVEEWKNGWLLNNWDMGSLDTPSFSQGVLNSLTLMIKYRESRYSHFSVDTFAKLSASQKSLAEVGYRVNSVTRCEFSWGGCQVNALGPDGNLLNLQDPLKRWAFVRAFVDAAMLDVVAMKARLLKERVAVHTAIDAAKASVLACRNLEELQSIRANVEAAKERSQVTERAIQKAELAIEGAEQFLIARDEVQALFLDLFKKELEQKSAVSRVQLDRFAAGLETRKSPF